MRCKQKCTHTSKYTHFVWVNKLFYNNYESKNEVLLIFFNKFLTFLESFVLKIQNSLLTILI